MYLLYLLHIIYTHHKSINNFNNGGIYCLFRSDYWYLISFDFLLVCFFNTLKRKIFISFVKRRYKIIQNVTKTVTITAATSKSRYWYHDRSTAAERKCGAPPCLMTYSVQKMAVSSGVWGRSLNCCDIFLAFSLYLKFQTVSLYTNYESWSDILSQICMVVDSI